ncbi:TrkH family potassium uptake protein [Candidatus Latescibacterota bacterium]
MKKSNTVQTVFHLSGSLIMIQGFVLLIPLLFVVAYHEYALFTAFLISSFASFATGFLLQKLTKPGHVTSLQSMLVCGMAWILLSLFGCLPFYFGTDITFLDAYFETVSGFTTTGITLIINIEAIPKSLLFWRSLIQWLGGLGILTFFLAITYRSNITYFQLFSAESHKIDSSRPTPSIAKTVVILWVIYSFITLLETAVLKLLGLSFLDAICHSFTTLSTGGFSTYNASIDYFRRAGFTHYKAIEYALTFFMFLGGVNFLLHYKILSGRFRDVSRNTELRTFVSIIFFATAFIMIEHYRYFPGVTLERLETEFRHSIFTVVSLITTTGYGTTDINEPYFPVMAKQIFLLMMLIGGCVGSTGGGIKVMRIIILFKAFTGQIKRLWLPRKAFSEVVINNKIIPDLELKRVTGLFFGWLLLILVGGLITAFFARLGSWESLSGMFSAVGNIGPCYISVQQMSDLPAIVKITYIFGMLAGRLEILPILLIFSGKAWQR